MPVKIKHKQLGNIETVAYINWDKHYNKSLWDIVEMWDVGNIYNIQGANKIYQSTVDKSDFLDAMKHPVNQNALFFEDLPNIGRRLCIKAPRKYIAIKDAIKIIHKIINNKWIFGIITSLLASLIFYLAIKYWPL